MRIAALLLFVLTACPSEARAPSHKPWPRELCDKLATKVGYDKLATEMHEHIHNKVWKLETEADDLERMTLFAYEHRKSPPLSVREEQAVVDLLRSIARQLKAEAIRLDQLLPTAYTSTVSFRDSCLVLLGAADEAELSYANAMRARDERVEFVRRVFHLDYHSLSSLHVQPDRTGGDRTAPGRDPQTH